MVAFLTPEWIDRLDRAARESEELRRASGDETMVLEQVVRDGPAGEVSYHIVLGPGQACVQAGRSEQPTVTITVAFETAVRISSGEDSAQAAFMTGRLRLGGDVGALLRHREALSRLDDVFAAVRAETTYEHA